ncbi:hypothetical protein [Nitrosovibrio sp. Nv4]|uniref:hypothetical protein n=1 Tax=Nitrosovibrio sp. Nv4 TaxID=1945880 RepID=UPI000BDAC7FE|nr:hypothetical protein [Nitrosovibrio sp. Nv4]SOD41517.1 hypothetical protein SAMN06298226_1817 [Nitrosovibrio sp. Nv4]
MMKLKYAKCELQNERSAEEFNFSTITPGLYLSAGQLGMSVAANMMHARIRQAQRVQIGEHRIDQRSSFGLSAALRSPGTGHVAIGQIFSALPGDSKG